MYIYTWHIHIGMYFTSTRRVLNPGIETDTKYWCRYRCTPSENTLVFAMCLPRSLETTGPLFLPSISSAFFVFWWCLFLFCESGAEHLSLIDASDRLRNSHCALCWGPSLKPVAAESLCGSVPLLAFGLRFELWIRQFFGIMSSCRKNGWKEAGFGGVIWLFLRCSFWLGATDSTDGTFSYPSMLF